MLDERVMLITGTSRGIGAHLAETYTRRGMQVVGCSRRSVDFTWSGYTHFSLDVSDELAVKEMFAAIDRKYGRLDVLLNNAAVASMNHSLLTPLRSMRQILETNVVGTFLFCREAAKLMRRRQFGRIVNFASVATPLKLEGEAAYACSKAAVTNLTEILARELAEFGITVNAVGPTPVMTDLIRAVPKEKIQQLIDRQAIRRLGRFEDIENVIDFYIRRESEFVTGQTVFLGGV